MKVELDLSNCATNVDLKNATGGDTLDLKKKLIWANLKSDVYKLVVDKVVPVPVDLRKLSDLVKIDVVKKDVYNVKIKYIEDKIPNITNLATNTTLNAKINEIKNVIHSITNLATTTALNANINRLKTKIPNITNLATTTALTAVKNEILDHSAYITTPEFNK